MARADDTFECEGRSSEIARGYVPVTRHHWDLPGLPEAVEAAAR